MSNCDFLSLAKHTIHTEQRALDALVDALDDAFAVACQMLLQCTGRVVITGMGKSGHIGKKIAATMASTGTPAFFLHPAEAAHGDLGMICQNDILIMISNSGESDEICVLLPAIKRLGIPTISISTGGLGTLATAADVALSIGKSNEACPLNLAPTSSTTATLVLGDALCVCLMHAKNIDRDDFAKSHPAGALGRKLLMQVSHLMHQDNLPIVSQNTTLQDTLLTMTKGRLGLAVVVDDGRILGVFTDGDLRRKLSQNCALDTPIGNIMSKNPKTIDKNAKAVQALSLMHQNRINQLPVIQDGVLVGIISLQDLMQARIKYE